MATDFLTNQEILEAARRNLSDGAWGYLIGGSESETTARRNRLAFDAFAFRPRVLVDVSRIDASASLLGQQLRIPVILAPIGSLQIFDPVGGIASALAASEFGTLQAVSSSTAPGFAAIAAAAPGPKVLQLYIDFDIDWLKDTVHAVKAAGYVALAITVDRAIPGRSERPLRSRWQSPSSGRQRDLKYAASATWDLIDELREAADLPLILKGVVTAEDAALAVQHGVKVVWISDHGAKQLDHSRGTMDALPEVVAAVRGRAEVVLDSGVQRGSDVIKAIALGAKAVAIGKLQGWGLAAAGKDGVVRVLEILEDEIQVAMGLLGVGSLVELTPGHIVRADPVTPPHQMSGWPGLEAALSE